MQLAREAKPLYKTEDFVKLGVRAKPNRRFVWMRVLKSTADFYGWSTAFPPLLQLKKETLDVPFLVDQGRKSGGPKPGYSVVICRSESTAGWPAGLTNRFTVSSDASLKDLALIAQAVKVDWGWMTAHYGERKRRGWWEQAPSS